MLVIKTFFLIYKVRCLELQSQSSEFAGKVILLKRDCSSLLKAVLDTGALCQVASYGFYHQFIFDVKICNLASAASISFALKKVFISVCAQRIFLGILAATYSLHTFAPLYEFCTSALYASNCLIDGPVKLNFGDRFNFILTLVALKSLLVHCSVFIQLVKTNDRTNVSNAGNSKEINNHTFVNFTPSLQNLYLPFI